MGIPFLIKMAKYVLRTIFIALVYVSWTKACPQATYWIEAGESCYRSLPDLEAQSWYDAKRFCQGEDGYLVEIQSAEEMETIKTLFSMIGSSGQVEITSSMKMNGSGTNL